MRCFPTKRENKAKMFALAISIPYWVLNISIIEYSVQQLFSKF